MSDDFLETIISFVDDTIENVVELRIDTQKAIAAGTIELTPVDTGLAKRNWQSARDFIPTDVVPYAGNPKSAEAGAISKAQKTSFGEDGVWYFVNNLHYIYYLEYGTPKMSAVAMAGRTAKRVSDNLRNQYG